MSDSGFILSRVARGESGAMSECIDSYGGLVWSIARKFARAEADAEDLVQEIFIVLWKNAERFDPRRASEVTFIGLLARRRSIDWLRAHGRRPDFEPLSGEAEEVGRGAERPLGDLQRDELFSVMKRLPGEMQRLFQLHFEKGMSHGEIAEETGLPLGTVKTRLRTGLIELRRLVKKLDSPQPDAAL